MGMIEDITNLMRKGPALVSQLDPIKINTKSVVRGAKDATFQFPCLMSDTIPIDLANTLVNTLDRVYADFTQTWISLHPFMDMSLDPTPMSYLKRLHQNMKVESVQEFSDNGEEYERIMKEAYEGENLLYMNPNKTYGVMISGANKGSYEMIKSHTQYLREYMSDFNLAPITEAPDGPIESAYDLTNRLLDSKTKQMEDEKRNNMMNQMRNRDVPKLLDRDVKKTNELTPFGIQVRLIAKNEKNEFVQYVDFIVGVKAILHPVKSDDVIDNIKRALQNKSLFFKFLRWTSGEISLFKNIVLNVDDIKLDANRNASRSPWFPALKRLKNKKIGVSNLTVPHGVIPNATLAISSYEADELLNKSAIDIRQPAIAKKIMSQLSLIAFVIIDEATGTVNILYDGDSDYQTYSLETLQRQNDLTSNKLGREIGRMISH